jgi:hypothetical protein
MNPELHQHSIATARKPATLTYLKLKKGLLQLGFVREHRMVNLFK